MARSSIGSVYLSIKPESQGFVDALTRAVENSTRSIQNSVSTSVETGMQQGAQAGADSVSSALQDAASDGSQGVGTELSDGLADGAEGGIGRGFRGAGALIGGLVAAWGLSEIIGGEITTAFESQTSNASLAAALALTPEERKTIEGVAGDLFSNAYGESRQEVNDAMRAIVGSIEGAREASTAELTQMGKDVLNLSTAYELTADEITRAGQSFVNNGMGSFSDFTDLTAKAFANLGQAGAEDYLDTITEYAGDLKNAGLDAVETLNMFKNAVDQGFYNTDRIGDMLQEITIKTVAGDADEVLTKFGFDPATIRAAADKGGEEWEAAWTSVLDKIAKEGNQADATAFGGSILEEVWDQARTVDWAGITDSSNAVANSMEQIDKTLNDTAAVSFETMKRQFSEAFQGVLLPALEAITPFIQKFATWISENERLAQIIGGVLVVAMTAFTVAVMANAVAWLANPMTYIVLAVVAAVALLAAGIYLLVTNWDAVYGAVSGFFGAIGEWIGNAWANISGFFGNIGSGVATAFQAVVSWIGNAVSAVGNFFGSIGSGIANVWSNITSFAGNVVQNIRNVVGNIFSGIVNGISNVITGAVSIVGGAINGIRNVFSGFSNAVQSVFKGIGNFLIGAANLGIRGINGLLSALNRIKINVPQWVPGIGGRSWGVSIPLVPQIPALATGADIMGPTVALIGERDPETVTNRGQTNRMIEMTNMRLDRAERMEDQAPIYIENKIYAAPGMDEALLAEKVASESLWRRKREG